MKIRDAVSPLSRRRIEAAQADFARQPTEARWEILRRVMLDAEREANATRQEAA